MRVLGIDPGTVVMGYGVLDLLADEVSLVESGVLRASPRLPLPQRLLHLQQGLDALLDRLVPEAVAVERPFVARNVRSAFAIGEARGIALLAAAKRGLPIAEYPPARVRSEVSGYGGSDKAQVARVLGLQLGVSLEGSRLDATDALAVALCHILQSRREAQMSLGSDGGEPRPAWSPIGGAL
ncbi:MAG: crossover junction endodeoxyribonuclease RuvC [Chloroflexi bacterium]|nr:crossover junction endodeoxyribonuclease RuvC [Chloroflexota bacterium]